jgi:predicted transcriptional regulator of viral defense system
LYPNSPEEQPQSTQTPEQESQRLRLVAPVHAPRGVNPSQVPYLLKVLTDAGWLIRLRRGLYAGTGQLPGGVDVPPMVIARALVTPSTIGLVSALAYRGLSDQVPRVISVVTPKKVVTPTMRGGSRHGAPRRHVWHVAGIDCRFTTVRQDRYQLGLERAWIEDGFSFSITDRERTVLDLFAVPRQFGGITEGLDVLDRDLASIDVDKLVDYAIRYGSATVSRRVGWCLAHTGVRDEPADASAGGTHRLVRVARSG